MIRRGLWCAVLVPLLLILLPFSAHAQEITLPSADEDVPEELFDLFDALPSDVRDLLPEKVFSTDRELLGEGVREMSDLSYLLRTLLSIVGLKLGDCVALFASVTGLLLISSVVSALRSSLRSERVARAFSFCSTLVVTLSILSLMTGALDATVSYFSTLNALTAASIPVMTVLYTLGGNATAAVASSAGLSVFMTVTEELIGKSILPFCGLCSFLAVMRSLDPSIRLGTLLGAIKKHYATALTFLTVLLIAMLSTQTLLAARGDTVLMRGAKFATGNLIPVVGGSVSELLKTVCAGVGYLRGAVGLCGTLLLLLTLLPTLVELLLLRLAWQLTASVADLLGCESEKRLLEEVASLIGYLVAAVSICSSILLVAFTILTHCATALG